MYSTSRQLAPICSWVRPRPDLFTSCGASQIGAESQAEGWGGSGLGLLEAIMFLAQLLGPGAQSRVALGPGGDHAALLTNTLSCFALGRGKEATKGF